MSLHKKISFTKSIIRIIGYFAFLEYVSYVSPYGTQPFFMGALAGWILVISEVIGLIEEIDE